MPSPAADAAIIADRALAAVRRSIVEEGDRMEIGVLLCPVELQMSDQELGALEPHEHLVVPALLQPHVSIPVVARGALQVGKQEQQRAIEDDLDLHVGGVQLQRVPACSINDTNTTFYQI